MCCFFYVGLMNWPTGSGSCNIILCEVHVYAAELSYCEVNYTNSTQGTSCKGIVLLLVLKCLVLKTWTPVIQHLAITATAMLFC